MMIRKKHNCCENSRKFFNFGERQEKLLYLCTENVKKCVNKYIDD